MANQAISLEPVVNAVDDVTDRLRNAQFHGARAFEREKALRMLEAVRSLLLAFCLAPSGEQGYYHQAFGEDAEDEQ